MEYTTTIDIQPAIVQTLAYYDLFEYPLTAQEIFTFLPMGGCDEDELREALDESVETDAVRCVGGYYYLPHRGANVVERRLAMQKRGAEMWKTARFVASFMRHVPFVRGVFISGQLCRYIADEKSDIDYFLVTEPGRLWIVRTLFVFIRRTLLFNKRKYFCTNYFVTTGNLKIAERNPYVACEVASLKPMYNRELFERFMAENNWIGEYYPNYSMERIEFRRGVEGRSLTQRIIEALLPGRLTARLDERLMETTRNFWQRKFPNREKEMYDVALCTRRNESRAHPEDKTAMVLQRYNECLRRYGIAHD